MSGFVGVFLILLGSFERHPSHALLAIPGLVLVAAYLVWLLRRVFFGQVTNPENRGLIDLDVRERALLLAIAIPILWIGIHPNPLLRRIEPSVLEVLRVMAERRAESELEPKPEIEFPEGERALTWLLEADPDASAAARSSRDVVLARGVGSRGWTSDARGASSLSRGASSLPRGASSLPRGGRTIHCSSPMVRVNSGGLLLVPAKTMGTSARYWGLFLPMFWAYSCPSMSCSPGR